MTHASMEIKKIIRQCLSKAGLESLPAKDDQKLADFGLDSLCIVLTVSELEQALGITLPASEIREDWFRTIDSLTQKLSKFVKN